MSNITSLQIGQKKIEIPNAWIEVDSTKSSSLVYSGTLQKDVSTQVDFSSILPNDSHAYECQLMICGQCGTNCAGTLTSIDGSIINRLWVADSAWTCNQFNCLIGTSRKVTITVDNSNLSDVNLRVYRYRKV